MRALCFGFLLSILLPAASGAVDFNTLIADRDKAFWDALGEQKIVFVVGYLVGHGDCVNAWVYHHKMKHPQDRKNLAYVESKAFPKQPTFGEWVRGIDVFYRDPRNAALPVKDAFFYTSERMKGTDPKILEMWLREARKYAGAG